MPALAVGLTFALAGCAYSYSTGMGGYVENRSSPLMPWLEPSSGAPMAPDRKISEQDCTAPIVSTTANLKCK